MLRCERLQQLKSTLTSSENKKEREQAKQIGKNHSTSGIKESLAGSFTGSEVRQSNQKLRITRERSDKLREVQGFSFGIRWIILTMFGILLIVPIYAMIRYVVLLSLVTEPIYALKLICNTVETYSNILALDVSLLEMVAWNNSVQVASMPAKDFALSTIDNLLAIHAETLELSKNRIGDTGSQFADLLNKNTCRILADMNAKKAAYANCQEAIADIVNQPLIKFLPLYFRMAQQFTIDWTNSKDYAERITLLKEPHYASMVAYQVYNSLGLADEIYYTLMLPIVTTLLDQLDSIEPSINLTSIISALFLALMLPIGANSAYFSLERVLIDYWELIYFIPLRLIETSARLRQKLKLFHKNKSFGSFT